VVGAAVVLACSSALGLAWQGLPWWWRCRPISPPEYKAAEAKFRQARTPEDRLRWLREMLRTIPKHKGTEHLRGDIKSRIKDLTQELAAPRKGGARTGPPTVVVEMPANLRWRCSVAELREVGPARPAHRLARRCEALPVHHPIPPARHVLL
jgi:hypothetical protein